MSFQVRSITADELAEWVEVMHTAFHSNWPAQPEAEHRRDVYLQDLERTYATFEQQQPGANAQIVGTYESFTTDLTLPGGVCVNANAISSISVLPTHHRRGLLTHMITQDLRAARERGELASVLIAAEYPIYGRFGFGPATQRTTYKLDLAYTRFRPDTPRTGGSVRLVEPNHIREPAQTIFEQFRKLHAGQIGRREGTWDVRLDIAASPWRDTKDNLRCALYTDPEHSPEGYALYRVHWDDHTSTLQLNDLITLTDEAYIGLWRFAAELDLLNKIEATMRPVDEPLPFLLTDPRKALQQTRRDDFLWVRVMDVASFLEKRRYSTDGKLVLQIEDSLGISGGCFALEGGADGATCMPSSASADVTLSLRALGAISLGGVAASTFALNGEAAEHTPKSLKRLERMFHTSKAPWCSTFF